MNVLDTLAGMLYLITFVVNDILESVQVDLVEFAAVQTNKDDTWTKRCLVGLAKCPPLAFTFRLAASMLEDVAGMMTWVAFVSHCVSHSLRTKRDYCRAWQSKALTKLDIILLKLAKKKTIHDADMKRFAQELRLEAELQAIEAKRQADIRAEEKRKRDIWQAEQARLAEMEAEKRRVQAEAAQREQVRLAEEKRRQDMIAAEARRQDEERQMMDAQARWEEQQQRLQAIALRRHQQHLVEIQRDAAEYCHRQQLMAASRLFITGALRKSQQEAAETNHRRSQQEARESQQNRVEVAFWAQRDQELQHVAKANLRHQEAAPEAQHCRQENQQQHYMESQEAGTRRQGQQQAAAEAQRQQDEQHRTAAIRGQQQQQFAQVQHQEVITALTHEEVQQPVEPEVVYGRRKDGEPCSRCIEQGCYCYQHKDQEKTVYGLRKDGQPCRRCMDQGCYCWQHLDQAPGYQASDDETDASSSSETVADTVYGRRKDGQPCTRCIRMGDFCHQHEDQRP